MSGKIEIRKVRVKGDREEFVNLPWKLYRDDPNWIPPLLSDMHNTLDPEKNALLRLGPSCFLLAIQGGRVVGRLGVGIDKRLNSCKKENLSYFTLFESIEDFNVAKSLFTAGTDWLRREGAETITGPQSPSNGDDYRGLLIEGFNCPPVLLNSYNPPYYADLIEQCGFKKQFDRNAYYFDFSDGPPERLIRGVRIIEERYRFKVRQLDKKNLNREMAVIKEVVNKSMPEWPDMIPPSDEEIAAEAAKLKQLAISELVLFIENSAGECLGFSVTLPDYNEVLARLNGRLFPTGFLKFLYYRRKIKGVRMFVLFVTPAGRRRGVSASLYYHSMVNSLKMGFRHGEGSTIHEFNERMNLDARKAGGVLYKKYRIYRLEL